MSSKTVYNIDGKAFNSNRYNLVVCDLTISVKDIITSQNIIDDITKEKDFLSDLRGYYGLGEKYIAALNNDHNIYLINIRDYFYY